VHWNVLSNRAETTSRFFISLPSWLDATGQTEFDQILLSPEPTAAWSPCSVIWRVTFGQQQRFLKSCGQIFPIASEKNFSRRIFFAFQKSGGKLRAPAGFWKKDNPERLGIRLDGTENPRFLQFDFQGSIFAN